MTTTEVTDRRGALQGFALGNAGLGWVQNILADGVRKFAVDQRKLEALLAAKL